MRQRLGQTGGAVPSSDLDSASEAGTGRVWWGESPRGGGAAGTVLGGQERTLVAECDMGTGPGRRRLGQP